MKLKSIVNLLVKVECSYISLSWFSCKILQRRGIALWDESWKVSQYLVTFNDLAYCSDDNTGLYSKKYVLQTIYRPISNKIPTKYMFLADVKWSSVKWSSVN